MKMTLMSDYALRVLMYLGAHPDRLSTISEIARSYGISENHLMKVVNRLSQVGFVEATRGRGGGLSLGKPAAEIGLGEVLRLTEEDFHIVECFGSENACRIAGACRLKRVLRRALAAYFAELDSWTLADLVSNRKTLRAIFDGVPN